MHKKFWRSSVLLIAALSALIFTACGPVSEIPVPSGEESTVSQTDAVSVQESEPVNAAAVEDAWLSADAERTDSPSAAETSSTEDGKTAATTERTETTAEKTTRTTTKATTPWAPAATTKPTQTTTTTRRSTTAATSAPVDYQQEVLRLVNIERAKAGKQPLSSDMNLNQAAQVRAQEIVRAFSHTRPDGRDCFTAMKEAGVSYRAAGENIAMGQRTPEQVVAGWMDSDGHRENILSDRFGRLGVGYHVENGRAYWVQMFAN